MSERAKALVLRHHEEVWSRGALSAVDEIYEPDFVGHHPGQLDWTGPEKVRDWLVERRDATRVLDVRITLRTDGGQLIYAHYPALFHGPPAVMERLARGEMIGASEYYFRTAPLFENSIDDVRLAQSRPGRRDRPADAEAGQLHRVRHCVKRKGQRRCST